MISMNDNEMFLQELYFWYKKNNEEKIRWILRKQKPQNITVEEIQFIGRTLEGLISSIHKESGEEYITDLLKKIELNENESK